MNGVVRSIRVNKSNHANAARSASRYGGQTRTWVNYDVGFRLNGVYRGCSTHSSFSAKNVRSGYRVQATRLVVGMGLGFRCEWCIKRWAVWESGRSVKAESGCRAKV